MKVRDQEKIYDLEAISEEKLYELMKLWNRNRNIECLCLEDHNRKAPLLFVSKNPKEENQFHFKNNRRGNEKRKVEHSFDCPYHPNGYVKVLRDSGMKRDDNTGEIDCRIQVTKTNKKKNEKKGFYKKGSDPLKENTTIYTQGYAALQTLLNTMLQEKSLHKFNPDFTRNISNQLLSMSYKIKVNKTPLHKQLYLAGKSKYLNDGSRLLIAWGKKQQKVQTVKKLDFLYQMPLYSLESKEEVTTILINKKLYETAIQKTHANVKEGYWVLWREENNKKKIIVTDATFVPAERDTMIPVESSYEEEMIQYLVENHYHFAKPLIGNVTELFLDLRPDMILYNTTPQTIVEVAGMEGQEAYEENLKKKMVEYKEKGYQYIEWNGKTSIHSVFENITKK